MSERNPGKPLEALIRAAMGAGVACFTDKLRDGQVDPNAPLSEAFGDFPAKFLETRPDLVDEVVVELLDTLNGATP